MFDFLRHGEFEDSVIVTIGLTLSPDQQSAAIQMSKHLCANEDCSLILDAEHNPPRVRLYESVFPLDQETQVLSRAEALASTMIQFTMKWGSCEVTTHFATIWGESNEPLSLFHDAVLEKISPLRHGFFKQKYLDTHANLTSQERASVERWGSPWAYPYEPHMIFAKSTTTFLNIPTDVQWDYPRCTFPGVIVGIRSGKILESIHTFAFSSP